jgi:hypothetical protein
MSEPQRPPHPEQPAEGQDAGSEDEAGGRTPHSEQPAEGEDVGGESADSPG